jgi:iron complex outermembrane receptor protein
VLRRKFGGRSAIYLMTASAMALLGAPLAYAEDGVEQVTVTGSLISNPGFAAPTPVTTVSTEQIEQRAAGAVFEIIRDIPSFNGTSGPTANSSGAQSASKANLNLRSLGAQRTLVLIDGERHVPDAQTNVFDSNLIPTSLIQRIDIVTGGASATYGSDAVAGVVNFILDKHFEGFKGDWHAAVSQYSDGVEFNPSLAWGTSLLGGRGHFIIGGDITINEGTGTKYTRGWGRLEPGVFTTPAVRPVGLPAQLVSNNVETSAYNASGLIVSGPLAGTVFQDGGQTSQLQFGPIVGSTEMCCGNGDYGSTINPDEALMAAYDRGALLTRFEYDINDNTTAYVQFHYGHLNTFGTSFGAQVPNFNKYTVLNTNPFLPPNIVAAMAANKIASFQYSATRDYDLSSIASRNRTDSMQGNLGASGKISNDWLGNWQWKADLGLGAATFHPKIYNTPIQANFFESAYVVAGPNGVPVCGPVATNPYFNAQNAILKAQLLATLQPGCVPYNIFGNNVAQNKAANAYFNSASEEDNQFRQYTFDLNFSGEPLTLPAGPVSVAFGYDWRRDAIDVVNCPECMLNALMNQNYSSYIGDILVNEFYAETDIPLLKDYKIGDLSVAQSLGMNAAVRNTNYSTSGDVTTWKVGLTWDVDDSLRLRGTRSFDIRAPNVNELFNPGSQGNANVVNQTNNTSGFIKTNTVGNTSLRPEEGNTWTAGIVFQPTWDLLNGLNVSIDYYHIQMTQVISTLPVQTVLNDYFTFGANSVYARYVVPSAATAVGVSTVNSPELNLNGLLTDGVDMEIDYTVPDDWGLPGSLTMRALGTWTDQFKTATPTNNINSVGQISSPRMAWNILLTHSIDRFQTDFMIRYTSPTLYDPTLVGLDGLTPGSAQYNATAALPNSINRNIWPGALYYNASFAYDILERRDDQRLQVYLNINDIFNKKPPIIATSLNGGPYDLIGRYFKLGVRFAD